MKRPHDLLTSIEVTGSNAPLVSVVTPSYNAAAFTRETIESVRSQDYPAIEHIIMDGGSTDGTVEILQEYPHLIWVSERDRGQSHALNKGFVQARGEIVGWLNADDLYQPGAIRRAVSFLTAHPEVSGVYSDCLYIDEQGLVTRLLCAQEFDVRTLLIDNYIPQPTVFLRRAVLQEVGLLDEELKYVMDWDLWLRIGARHRLARLSGEPLASFRLCQGTKSNDQAAEFDIEYVKVLKRLFHESPYREMPSWWRWRAFRRAWSRHYMAVTFAAHEMDDHAAVRRNLPIGVLHNLSWLRNRGIWSIGLRAFFGDPTMEQLRRLSTTRRSRQ